MNTRPLIRLAAVLAAIVLSAPGLVNAKVSLNSSLSIETVTQAGRTYSGVIKLNNSGDRPATVKLYQTDYSFQADGNTQYGPPGADVRSNAAWIGLPSDRVTVPAETVLSVSYTVSVPDDPALVGSYWSVIMVEPLPEASPELTGELAEDNSVHITTLVRYAIQVITEIDAEAERVLELLSPSITLAPDGHHFSIDLKNPGQKALVPRVWVQVFGSDGQPVARAEAKPLRIYPGSSARFHLAFDHFLPAGQYRGLAVADAGGDDVFGINLDLNIEAAASNAPVAPDG